MKQALDQTSQPLWMSKCMPRHEKAFWTMSHRWNNLGPA